MPLTARQERFIAAYLTNCNATRAAQAAGYSEKTAYAIGWENLKKPEIAREIRRRQDALAAEAKVDAQWVISRLKAEALRGGSRASHAARVRALELLGKHLGMFKGEGLPDPMDEAFRRIRNMTHAELEVELQRALSHRERLLAQRAGASQSQTPPVVRQLLPGTNGTHLPPDQSRP